jgi:trigger factor
VTDFSGVAVKEPQVKVTDKDIQEDLRQIQDRNALILDRKPEEAAVKGDIVTATWCELDDDGKEIKDSERKDAVLNAGGGSQFGLDEDVIGMKAGETKDVKKTYKKTHEDKELAGATKKFKVSVSAIKVKDLPAIDDELAQDVNEKFKSLADLKADITKRLENSKTKRVEELKVNALLDALVERNPFEVPVSMIQVELEARMRNMAMQLGMQPDELEKIFAQGKQREKLMSEWSPQAEKQLKSRIIVESLMNDKNITVTPEEIEAELQRIADEAGVEVGEVKEH